MKRTAQTKPVEEITVSEAAMLAGVDARNVRRWIEAGHVAARQLPGGATMPFLVVKQSLTEYLASRKKKPA